MPRTKKFVPLTRRQLLLRVHAYVNAHVALSWKGGGGPADIPEIEARLDEATVGIFHALDNIDRLRAEHAELREAATKEAHARLSPSGSKKWMACPGSITLEAALPNTASKEGAK